MASLSDNFKIDSTELSLNLAAQFEDSASRKAGHRVVQLHGVPAFIVQSLRAATCPHHQVCAQTSQSRLFSPSNSRLLVPQLPLLEQPHLLSLLHLQQLEQQSFAVQGANLTRNLIPLHPKASDVSASLLATRIRQSAIATPALLAPLLTGITQAARAAPTILRPALTVQDLPMAPPFYNGVNPNYPGLHVLNNSPPIFAVDNFLTPYECDFLINAAVDALGPAPVVGKGAGEISPSRTSSTCYLAREDLGDLMRKVSLLTGKPAEHCELPQVGRYFYQEKYLQHFDGRLRLFRTLLCAVLL